MKTILPMNDYVLVRRDAAKAETPGGLIIPANAQEKMHFGTVVAVGRGKVEAGKLQEPQVKKGDAIVFGKYAGQEFELDGEKGLLFLRESEILGVLEERQT